MADLEFKDVSKAFGSTVVIKDLNLKVKDGELFVLLGPSGCGKSTILRLIAGLEAVDKGEILINGNVINNIPPKDRNVAMVFQNYALYPHMTIYDNLAFPLKVKKVPKERIREIVQKQANLLGLSEFMQRKPKTLSGGQRQRVALGRALVRDPQVFLFDEPLSNLDAKLRVSTRAEIASLQRRLNATMIYVTHDQEEALSLGDRIAILNEGILQQIGTPQEIYNQPHNTFCASFVGSPKINLLKAESANASYLTIERSVKVPIQDHWKHALEKEKGKSVILGIRPENLFFSRRNDSDLEFEIEITHTEFAGDRLVVFAALGGEELRIKSSRILPIEEGKSSNVYVDPDDCLLFDIEHGKRLV
jgi:multiple sugar transport system ATP-binding protein